MDAFGHKSDKSKVNVGAMLTANNKEFYFDYQNGQYGFNTDPDRGASTFHAFGEGGGDPVEIWSNTYRHGHGDSATINIQNKARFIGISNTSATATFNVYITFNNATYTFLSVESSEHLILIPSDSTAIKFILSNNASAGNACTITVKQYS